MSIDRITAENLSFELKVGVALLDGPLSLTDLAAKMGVPKIQVGRGLDVLEDQGQTTQPQWHQREDGRWNKRHELSHHARAFFEKVRNHGASTNGGVLS